YNKDDVAAKQLSFEAMAKGLLQDTWTGLSEADRKEFLAHLETLIRRMSFTKGRDMFQYLDAVLYAPVTMHGEAAHCKSTVVVHRELKKTEIPIEWVLVKEGGAWKVADTVTLGESTTEGIRQDQVLPLLKEGGIPALMDALRKKAAELKKA
ncbi:MAG TPA: ABC transporter substrate-binding protein, partial [Myxococcota bacterium]|nr:ABC transporter substrate-binding protein [Myxococcota bacterium]